MVRETLGPLLLCLCIYLCINPKAVRREMSGYYQCQVIRAAEEGAGVLEAGVHVEVTVTEDGQEHQDTFATPRFVTPTSSALVINYSSDLLDPR